MQNLSFSKRAFLCGIDGNTTSPQVCLCDSRRNLMDYNQEKLKFATNHLANGIYEVHFFFTPYPHTINHHTTSLSKKSFPNSKHKRMEYFLTKSKKAIQVIFICFSQDLNILNNLNRSFLLKLRL